MDQKDILKEFEDFEKARDEVYFKFLCHHGEGMNKSFADQKKTKQRQEMMFKVGTLILMLLIAGVSLFFFVYTGNYKDDNLAEEMIEGYIEKNTGVEFDLTPVSKE